MRLGIRVPLPDAVRARIETEFHPSGGSCLTIQYGVEDQRALIATLEKTIMAVRLGAPPLESAHAEAPAMGSGIRIP